MKIIFFQFMIHENVTVIQEFGTPFRIVAKMLGSNLRSVMVRESFSHYVKIKVEWFSILQHTSQSGITGFHVPDQLVEVVSWNNIPGVQDEHRLVVTLHDGLKGSSMFARWNGKVGFHVRGVAVPLHQLVDDKERRTPGDRSKATLEYTE